MISYCAAEVGEKNLLLLGKKQRRKQPTSFSRFSRTVSLENNVLKKDAHRTATASASIPFYFPWGRGGNMCKKKRYRAPPEKLFISHSTIFIDNLI